MRFSLPQELPYSRAADHLDRRKGEAEGHQRRGGSDVRARKDAPAIVGVGMMGNRVLLCPGDRSMAMGLVAVIGSPAGLT